MSRLQVQWFLDWPNRIHSNHVEYCHFFIYFVSFSVHCVKNVLLLIRGNKIWFVEWRTLMSILNFSRKKPTQLILSLVLIRLYKPVLRTSVCVLLSFIIIKHIKRFFLFDENLFLPCSFTLRRGKCRSSTDLQQSIE